MLGPRAMGTRDTARTPTLFVKIVVRDAYANRIGNAPSALASATVRETSRRPTAGESKERSLQWPVVPTFVTKNVDLEQSPEANESASRIVVFAVLTRLKKEQRQYANSYGQLRAAKIRTRSVAIEALLFASGFDAACSRS
jgi:hypothetical protein